MAMHMERESLRYYLDLTKRANIIYLLNLLLDNYDGEQRIIAKSLMYNLFNELTYIMLIELGIEPKELNPMLVDELTS